MTNFRTILPTLVLGIGLVSSCNSSSDTKPKIAQKSVPPKVFSENPKLKSIVCDTFSRQMSDEKKIDHDIIKYDDTIKDESGCLL